jgi:hypothetical protein
VVFGQSPSSVESAMDQVMGLNSSEISHLTLAEENGLSCLTPMVVGESLSDVVVRTKTRIN